MFRLIQFGGMGWPIPTPRMLPGCSKDAPGMLNASGEEFHRPMPKERGGGWAGSELICVKNPASLRADSQASSSILKHPQASSSILLANIDRNPPYPEGHLSTSSFVSGCRFYGSIGPPPPPPPPLPPPPPPPPGASVGGWLGHCFITLAFIFRRVSELKQWPLLVRPLPRPLPHCDASALPFCCTACTFVSSFAY